MPDQHKLVAILPCRDLDASEAFYAKLGFSRVMDHEGYRILSDGKGAQLHLNDAVADWVTPSRNPNGLYLFADDVDELAAPLAASLIHPPEHKPWGMYEFALSDPDGTLVRVGRGSSRSLQPRDHG
jgi:catechol 2,3-dioxygenase-like lactoylglutathione lyase family enzyme